MEEQRKTSVLYDPGSRLNLFGTELQEGISTTDQSSPPFSELLRVACDHADRTGLPNIFESQALQTIVQCVMSYPFPLVVFSS